MKRIYLFGSSGVGKTTLGKVLAKGLELPFIELDALHHQSNWTSMDEVEFRDRVSDIVRGDEWVVDGAYSAVRDLILQRADTLIFLDYSRARIFIQLLSRTLRRGILRTQLWNGNRERLHKLFSSDALENVVLWSMVNFTKRRQQSIEIESDETLPAMTRLRFRHPRDTAVWLDTLAFKED